MNPPIYDKAWTAFRVLAVIGALVASAAYWLVSCDDCESRHGALIQDANGIYKCVPEAPR